MQIYDFSENEFYENFYSSKKSSKGKRPGKGGNRFWKSVGLGFKTPREAIEGMRSIKSFDLPMLFIGFSSQFFFKRCNWILAPYLKLFSLLLIFRTRHVIKFL